MPTIENLPKIEKGIPVPPRKAHRSMRAFMEALESGDSFLVEKSKADSFKTVASRLKIKIAQRDVSETHRRIWKL